MVGSWDSTWCDLYEVKFGRQSMVVQHKTTFPALHAAVRHARHALHSLLNVLISGFGYVLQCTFLGYVRRNYVRFFPCIDDPRPASVFRPLANLRDGLKAKNSPVKIWQKPTTEWKEMANVQCNHLMRGVSVSTQVFGGFSTWLLGTVPLLCTFKRHVPTSGALWFYGTAAMADTNLPCHTCIIYIPSGKLT